MAVFEKASKSNVRASAIRVQVPSEALSFYPIESLSWPKLIFVRLFASKRFREQRAEALQSYRESLHTCFIRLLSQIQKGKSGFDELNTFSFLLRDIDRFFSSKRIFLMGSRNIGHAKREAERLYIPALQDAICSFTTSGSPPTSFFNAVEKLLSKSFAKGDLDEDAVKRA